MNLFRRSRKVEFPKSTVTAGKEHATVQLTDWYGDEVRESRFPFVPHGSEPSTLTDDQEAKVRAALDTFNQKRRDGLLSPETLALFERVRTGNIREHGTPRAKVVKREGYWISIVYGSDGWPVLYDEVTATPTHAREDWPGGWYLIMESARDDLATVHRIECAGHRLPEAVNTTHY